MENFENSSWLTHQQRIFLRNVVLLFNATLWLIVLYFSVQDDETAAFFSYVSIISTILTVKYNLWEVIDNNKPVAYFIDCSSKVLIFAGIFLVLLPQYWNTAFYSICLGIIMQTTKREIQVRASNDFLYLLIRVSEEDAKIAAADERKWLEMENKAQEMQINKMSDLNLDECCTSISLTERNDLLLENTTDKYNAEMKECEENFQKDIESSHKKLNESLLNVSEILNDKEEKVLSCEKENLGDLKESDENSFHDHNFQRLVDTKEAVETTLKRMEYLTDTNVVSNYGDIEAIQRTNELCTLQIQLSNPQELESNEHSTLESKFEKNENIIERELRNEESFVNISVKRGALINKNLQDFSDGDSEQSFITDNSKTKPRNTVRNEFLPEQVNINSDVYTHPSETSKQKNDLIYSCNVGNSFQTCKNEGKDVELVYLKEVNLELFIRDNENFSPKNESTMFDTTLQYKASTGKVSSQKDDIYSRREISENNENLNLEDKYENTMKIINIQSEKEINANEIKCIPEYFNDKEIISAYLQHKEQIGEDCSTDFGINSEKNLNETNLHENSFDTSINSKVECSYMNCISIKTTDIETENDISQRKSISQVNDGNLEDIFGEKKKVIFESEYPFESKCSSNSGKDFNDDSSKLNESTDVEERNDSNEFVNQVSGDDDATHFSNVDDVVNRIDLSFIYALSFNVPRAK